MLYNVPPPAHTEENGGSGKGQHMQSIHRQIILLLTAMAISAVIILLSAAKGVERQKSEAAARQASMAEQKRNGFVLGEYEGKLALFRESSPKPYRILELELYLLPEEDLETIRSGGIIVETQEELEKLLEDWDS